MRPARTSWCTELSSLGTTPQHPGWGNSGSDLPQSGTGAGAGLGVSASALNY